MALLSSAAFRLYGGEDPIGAEVGGAAKNVIAIAAGAVIGAGLGENARAALVTRGLAELSRLAVALGGRAETAAGLTGLGDLMLTCAGPGSRNMSLGLALGRGESLAAVLAGRAGVTEGVTTAPAIVARAAAAGVELPICAGGGRPGRRADHRGGGDGPAAGAAASRRIARAGGLPGWRPGGDQRGQALRRCSVSCRLRTAAT